MHNRRYGAAIAGIISLGLLSGGALAEPKTNMPAGPDIYGSLDAPATAKLGEIVHRGRRQMLNDPIAGHTVNTLAGLRPEINCWAEEAARRAAQGAWRSPNGTRPVRPPTSTPCAKGQEGWEKVVAPEIPAQGREGDRRLVTAGR